MLAAKAALVSRVDALAEEENDAIGVTCREQVDSFISLLNVTADVHVQIENRIAGLEQRAVVSTSASLKAKTEVKKEEGIKVESSAIISAPALYNVAADVVPTLPVSSEMRCQ